MGTRTQDDMTVRDRLRAATRDAHEATDAAVERHGDVRSETGYANFLRVMLDAMTVFGDKVDLTSSMAELPPRSAALCDAIRTDLTVLGQTDFELTLRPPDRTLATADDQLLAQAFGSAYSLEGSALGASVLRNRVQPSQSNATSYLDHVIDDRRDRWPTFAAYLNEIPLKPLTFESICDGAFEVFDRVRTTALSFGVDES